MLVKKSLNSINVYTQHCISSLADINICSRSNNKN